MTTETEQRLSIGQQQDEFNHCMVDPIYWFRYVKIKDFTTEHVIPFEMWDHLKLLLLLLRDYKQIAALKAKQIGFSWTLGGYALWKCYRTANVVLLSAGEKEAAKLVGKSWFINSQLPRFLQLKLGHGKDGPSELLTFPDTLSEIAAYPSTEKAAVGETASLVIRDELEFHDYAEANFANVKPTVDAGAQIVDLSTSRRAYPNSHFKGIYKRAKAGENNYYPVFLPWYVRPDRDWEWYYRTKRDYYPAWLFEQDYPTTEEEALSSIEGLGLFEAARIEALLHGVGEPLRTPSAGCYIFHPFKPECRYYAGGDGAEGRGGDYSVIWIEGTDGVHRWLAAVLHSNMMTPDIFATHAYDLLIAYGRPLLVCGADAWGIMILKVLAKLGYADRIYCTDENGDKLGYVENKDNKQQNLMDFALAIRDGLTVEYKPAVEEMFGFNLENGKYESCNPHDDLVIAGAKATVARGLIPTDEYILSDHWYSGDHKE